MNVRVTTPAYSPAPPWTDGQQVTRTSDGTLFLYNAANNSLDIDPNIAGIVKDSNGFIVKNLPAPTAGGDAANKTYVDSKIPTGGGIGEAPMDGGTYAREMSVWTKVWDGGNY